LLHFSEMKAGRFGTLDLQRAKYTDLSIKGATSGAGT